MPPNARRVCATLGPASTPQAVLEPLSRLCDGLRLNASHLDPASLAGWLERLQGLAGGGAALPLTVDLQGAKMRLGDMPPLSRLPARLRLVLAERSADPAQALPVPHASLFAALELGDRLSLDDARVVLRVVRLGAEWAEAEVLMAGPLRAHKGINRPAHPLPFGGLGARDRALIQVAEPFAGVRFACSFVFDGSEAVALRAVTRRPLVAKIERPEAFDHLDAIAHGFDELWLCRGDLGAQAGLAALGPLQRRFAALLPALGRPAALAGQVLEHMTEHGSPTRAEVVQLYDAGEQGFEEIVLSDETAVGRQPLAVLETLADLGWGPQAARSSPRAGRAVASTSS